MLVACHNMCACNGVQAGGMDARALRGKILSVYTEAGRRLEGGLVPDERLSLLQCRQEVATHTSGLYLDDAETARCVGQSEDFVRTVLSRREEAARPQPHRLRLQTLWLLTHVLYPCPQEHGGLYALFRQELSRWVADAAATGAWPGLSVDETLWRIGLLNRAGYMFQVPVHGGLLARIAGYSLHLVPAEDICPRIAPGALGQASLACMVWREFYEMPEVRAAALTLGLRMGRCAVRYPDGSYWELLCSACGVEAGCELLEERLQECV